MVRGHALSWGSMSACDCLDITVCCGTVTSLVITNLSLHLAACETSFAYVRLCRKYEWSFSKPGHKHTSHPVGPAGESRT